MLIFIELLIIFSIFLTPAHLMRYALKRADFNTGQTVYENDVELVKIEDKLYEITSGDDSMTFHIHDLRTMLGTMVEFETFDPDPTVRCEFEDLTEVRDLCREIKNDVDPEIEFALVSTAVVLPNHDENDQSGDSAEIIKGGKLAVESGKQFHIIPGGRISLAVQMYDIETRQTDTARFKLRFGDADVAQSFYDYVNQVPDCINGSIPL